MSERVSESTENDAGALADGLFDRYALPKVAFAVILAASFAGTALSVRLTVGWWVELTVLKWAYFVALGLLAGGLLWKHAFVRPGDVEAASEYCGRMYDRFDRIALGATAVLVVSAVPVLGSYAARGVGTGLLTLLGASVAGVAVVGGYGALRASPASRTHRSVAGFAALGFALSVVLTTGVAEVAARGGDATSTAVRILHLLAFAAWIGGAAWNIFVAVPSGQERPSIAVVRVAGEQLERFRWAVRGIIPALLVTGIAQAVLALGTEAGAYVRSLAGLLVVVKLGFVVLLFGIFLACPMWRACSPIDGVCDLQNLDGGSDTEVSDR